MQYSTDDEEFEEVPFSDSESQAENNSNIDNANAVPPPMNIKEEIMTNQTDDDSQQAAEAMVQLGIGFYTQPQGMTFNYHSLVAP